MQQDEYKIQFAESLEKEGKLLHALQIYHILLKKKKYKRTAVVKLSEIYLKFNKIDKAILLFDDYLQENLDLEMRKYYAHFLMKNYLYENAIEVLQYISKETDHEAFYLIGLANYKLKEYEISKVIFADFVKKHRRSELTAEAYLYLSKSCRHLNEFEKAIEAAKLSELIWNRNFELYLNFAKIYYYKEMYLHAFESIKKSISINHSDLLLKKWAGKILYKMEEYQKAREYLLKYIDETVLCNDPEIFALLGGTYVKTKEYNIANNYFEMCLKLDPDNNVALKGKIDCSKFAI